MKVVVTGATGFIGRRALDQLAAQNVGTIIAAGLTRPQHDAIQFEAVNLLSPGAGADLMSRVRPTHWLHLAWNATPGAFWTARDNLDWMASTLSMLSSFLTAGGERAVFAGSCAEYDWQKPGTLKESAEIGPATLYGACKNELRRSIDLANAHLGASLAWGRVFWLYGPGEARGRLVSDVCAALADGKSIDVGDGREVRDFLHVDDVASAFVAALNSSFKGPFNIGSGRAVAVRDIIENLGEMSGRRDLIRLGARPTPVDLPPRLVADNRVLVDTLGWRQTIGLDDGLAATYAWWLKQVALR